LNLEKLSKLQKRAARIILNAKYDIPSLQLFKKLGWLSIQNRLIEYHKSVLMYKYINNSAPDYLCNLFYNEISQSEYNQG
jgi:predicted lipase